MNLVGEQARSSQSNIRAQCICLINVEVFALSHSYNLNELIFKLKIPIC